MQFVIYYFVVDMWHLCCCMYAGISFLRQLLEELKDVDNWFVLGIFLGVPVKQLQEIESSHRGEVEGCMIAMLQYWLNKNVTPSWKDVV